MFDIGWSEMAVIMLVALVVIGPKDLPRLARTLGQWVAKGRSMAREFQRSLEDMAREAELDDVKREIEKVGRTNIKKSIEKTIDPTGELGRAFDTNSSSPSSGKAPTKALGSAPNGEAKEPATKQPEVTSEQPATTAPATTAKAEPATAPENASKPRTPAKPKPKTEAKPKPQTEAKPKAAAKPRPNARPKPTTGNAPNTVAPETGKAETMGGPR
jgi:sec-independent protein translocase protein TatB